MIAAAQLLLAFIFSSGITIQILVFPPLIARITDRSAVTRVSHSVLKGHHTLAIICLIPAATLFLLGAKLLAALLTVLILALNLYQRLWIFTKIHLVKQPIGVQDLIQPDNVLREEFNRLQQRIYWLFRIHLLLVLIDLVLSAF